jgi:hypothetical protein
MISLLVAVGPIKLCKTDNVAIPLFSKVRKPKLNHLYLGSSLVIAKCQQSNYLKIPNKYYFANITSFHCLVSKIYLNYGRYV